MYRVTYKDMLIAINDYNIGKNNNLEVILSNVSLMSKCSDEAFYLNEDLDLPYKISQDYRSVKDIYYQQVGMDWYRLWYDAYINKKIISIQGDITPRNYIVFVNNTIKAPGFILIDSTVDFVNRDDSTLLDTVDIGTQDAQITYVTNHILDYMEGPSTEYLSKLLTDPKMNILPSGFVLIYSLALRSF